MPPKSKTTREMVVNAAFDVARTQGAAAISARAVARKLHCSTQPVMSHFPTVEALKRAAYEKADRFHTEYLMDLPRPQTGLMLGIGLNYIRFAIHEPHLFRFLFQSGGAVEHSLLEMVDSQELIPVLSAMGQAMGLPLAQTKEVFITIALFAHGYASILANNALEYDEKTVAAHLERAYRGAILAIQEEQHEKAVHEK